MRNKYSKEFEEALRERQETHDLLEMLNYVRCFWGYDINADTLRQYLYKRKIRYKNYNEKKNHPSNSLPIGSEYIKPDGMTLIKIAKDKWEYKQRYIYEQAYGNLPTETMVIFLDGNRNNFKLENLMAVSTPEYNCARNRHTLTKDTELTRAAMLSSRLYYKTKEKENERKNNKKRWN